MALYNITYVMNSTGFVQMVSRTNEVFMRGLLGDGVILVLWFVMATIFISQGGHANKGITAASFISFIFGVMLFALGWCSSAAVLVPLALTVLGVIMISSE